MKPLAIWFNEYGESHQNKINKRIHYLCVPVIFFTICGILMSVSSSMLQSFFPEAHPIFANWAFVALILVNLFYLRLSPLMGFRMLIFSTICLLGNYALSSYVTLWLFSVVLFALAWVGQFYGHHIEGKKPSFLKDIQFLLIGPAWVIDDVFKPKKK